MTRILKALVYGIVGLALAIGLTLGAYALAGKDLSEPAKPIRVGGSLAPKAAHEVASPAPSKPRKHNKPRKPKLSQPTVTVTEAGSSESGGSGDSGSSDSGGSDDPASHDSGGSEPGDDHGGGEGSDD